MYILSTQSFVVDHGFSLERAELLAAHSLQAYNDLSEHRRTYPGSRIEEYRCGSNVIRWVEDESSIVLAFRGSDDVEDWLTNLRFSMSEVVSVNGKTGSAHTGFWDAIQELFQSGLNVLTRKLQMTKKGVWITGHSLGGALATLYTWKVAPTCIHGVYTFGAPKVLDGDAIRLSPDLPRIYRLVSAGDPVPGVPPWLLGYRHVGEFVYLVGGKIKYRPGLWHLLKTWWNARVRSLKKSCHRMQHYYDLVKEVED